MRRVRHARGVMPRGTDEVTAFDRGHLRVLGRPAHRGDEMTVRSEDLLLSLLVPVRAELEIVRRGKAELPAGRRAASRDCRHHPVEGRRIELVATEALGCEHSVEAGPLELLVSLLGEVRALLGLGLQLEEPRTHRFGPADDLSRRHIRLGKDALLRPRSSLRHRHSPPVYAAGLASLSLRHDQGTQRPP